MLSIMGTPRNQQSKPIDQHPDQHIEAHDNADLNQLESAHTQEENRGSSDARISHNPTDSVPAPKPRRKWKTKENDGNIQHPNRSPKLESAIDHTISDHEPGHDRVLAIIIHRTDRLKTKTYITHPIVKIHVIDANTGEYAKKSHRQRAVAYVNETTPISVDHILPLMTKPSEFRQQELSAPTWDELLLFNDDFEHFINPSNNIMLMFEILDFKSMSAVKRDSEARNELTAGVENQLDGWHRIAWAFLKLVGQNGALNAGTNLRLQLYKAPATTKLRDPRLPEVYHWWKNIPKVKFSGTLFVSVKSVDYPRNVPPSTRSMYAVQQETVNGSVIAPNNPSAEEETAQDNQPEEKEIEEPQYVWSRLAGQPCKVPNKLWLTLACGRGGCFRVKFSQNGRYLAGAGAEQQLNKFPIYVYGFPHGKFQCALYGHVQLIYELSWNSSDLLLSASADCTARIWNVNHMRCTNILTHTTFVYCARFHPSDDSLIFTGAFDKLIRIWSLNSDQGKPKIIQEFEPHASYVNCICFTLDNRFMYSGDGTGTIRIWASADENSQSWMFLKEIREDKLLGKPINALEVHPDQKRLFVQSRDGCIRSMELRSLALRAHYRGLRHADTHVRGELTPCGTLYFAGDGDGKAWVWHVQSTQKYAEYDQLSLSQCTVSCVSYHPFDHWVAFALYGPRQPILVCKHDASVPELHKEEPQPEKVEKPQGPTFDPDYSLAKLLEEHRLLTKLDLPVGKWSASGQHATLPKATAAQAAVKAKAMQTPDASFGSKRVTFDDTIANSSPAQKHRQALFAKDIQQSTLTEIPLEKAKHNALSPNEDGLQALQPTVSPSIQKSPLIDQQISVQTELVSASAVIGQVRAKYNYTAQNEDEISFQKGDIIKVIKRDESWWVGYVNEEKIGYFPSNYVVEID